MDSQTQEQQIIPNIYIQIVPPPTSSQDQDQSTPPPNTTPPPPPHHPNIEIKLPTPQQQQQPSPSILEEVFPTALPENVPVPGGAASKQTRVMAMGFQKTLSKTSILVNFLPTGTLLAFEMLLPSVSGNGKCNAVSTFLIGSIVALCATTCCFFHFTDSYREDQKVYYGFVTFKGLMVFKDGEGVKFIAQPSRLKAGFTDFIHAVMSAMVFVAIAFSDQRVTTCLFPGHAKDMEEIMQTFPLMVGIVCSGLFLIFPNTRYGIGCMPT
ncbi:protein DMP8-like [Telopea speciosissima]|uniref:protein DMP8-like n=1 Tax=Telopea speciosissima TaxID=54955 RepID=UPI001CC76D76|nr:protein DMP8-like [Telopea speciosissima]